jgi:hypothetical protein
VRDQDINLAQLGDNLFSHMLLSSHDNILHVAQRHTSERTTPQAAGQRDLAPVPERFRIDPSHLIPELHIYITE